MKYAIKFQENILFSKKLTIFHTIMFFLIPFVWLLILKEIIKSAPGSYEIPNKVDNIPHNDAYSDAG